MVVYYTEGFKEILNNPSKYIKISKFKLGESGSVTGNKEFKTLPDIAKEEIWDNGTAPSIEEAARRYRLEGTLKNSTLTLSIEFPEYDSAAGDMDGYDILYVLYEDLALGDGKQRLAFILSGDIVNLGTKENPEFEFKPLYFDPIRTIINIENFNPKCSIVFKQSQDLEFLEGPGLGKPKSIYVYLNDDIEGEIGYVSRVSYEAYLLEKRSQDEYNHPDTTFINKYGLKIY